MQPVAKSPLCRRTKIIYMHCKDKIPKFRNKYSQKRNIGVSVPISTFICLWVIYKFPQSVFLFRWRKYVDRSWNYINRSQTHECGNWGWGRAIPRKGIHKWDFRCSAKRLISRVTLFDVQRAARTRWLSECRTSTPRCLSPRSAWSASPARSAAWSRIWESTSPCSGIFLYCHGLISRSSE